MSGEEANNKEWEFFVKQLKEKSGIEVELLDERLSSLAADALSGEDRDKAGRDAGRSVCRRGSGRERRAGWCLVRDGFRVGWRGAGVGRAGSWPR